MWPGSYGCGGDEEAGKGGGGGGRFGGEIGCGRGDEVVIWWIGRW